MMYNSWLQNNYGHWVTPFWGPLPVFVGLILVAAVVWTLVWKGMALWQAARRGEKIWFVVLLVINTLGVLEILYLYVFSKKSESVEKV